MFLEKSGAPVEPNFQTRTRWGRWQSQTLTLFAACQMVSANETLTLSVFVSVIIPALNEEEPIAGVVRECFATGLSDKVIVVGNASNDSTAERARAADPS